MKSTIDIDTLLDKEFILSRYSLLDLPEEWLSPLLNLSSLIHGSAEWKGWLEKAVDTFLNEEKPDFNSWEAPIIKEEPRDDFFIFISLLAADMTWTLHRKMGYPEDVTRETCRGIGTKSKDFYFFNQRAGVVKRSLYWFKFHARGVLFKIGRFEFMLKRASQVEKSFLPLLEGDPWVLDMHIPGGGAMDEDTTFSSWQKAFLFFDEYFPDKKTDAVVCVSWIFSPDIPLFLDKKANLNKLQNHVHIHPVGWSEREGVCFIMGDEVGDVDDWPEKTTLQRAYKSHIQRGGKVRTGGMFIRREDVFSH